MAAPSAAPAPFRSAIERIDAAQAKRMTGVSWRRGCPVALRDLRLLTLSHWGFDGRARTGRLIVHRDVARELVRRVSRALRSPLSDPPDGSRRRLRRERLSLHRGRQHVGLQLSLRGGDDPLVEPRVRPRDRREPDREPLRVPRLDLTRASRPYVDRSTRPGMAYEGGALVRAFDRIGWGWGGRWTSVQDYQHFSESGS